MRIGCTCIARSEINIPKRPPGKDDTMQHRARDPTYPEPRARDALCLLLLCELALMRPQHLTTLDQAYIASCVLPRPSRPAWPILFFQSNTKPCLAKASRAAAAGHGPRLEALDVHVHVRVQREQRPGHGVHARGRCHMARLDYQGQVAAAAAGYWVGSSGCLRQREGRRLLRAADMLPLVHAGRRASRKA
jgi:hypothetical protein